MIQNTRAFALYFILNRSGSESASCSVVPDSFVDGRKNTGVGSLRLLHGIFPTQESNPSLPHCMQILYQLSHKGSSKVLEWVAYPFSHRSSWPRNQTRVSHISGRFFINWAIREAQNIDSSAIKRNKVLVHAIIWINLENTILRERT